jgi:hypothetical protein
MRTLVAVFLLALCPLVKAATPSSLLSQASAFRGYSDNDLQIAKTYSLLVSVGLAGMPIGSIMASAYSAGLAGLSDRDLQVLQAYAASQGLVDIYVSPNTNSSTYGIQEALNQIPAGGPQWGTNVTGGHIHLAAGDYYITNSLFYSNTFPYSIRMEGAAILATRLIWAGNVRTNMLRFCGGGNPNGGLSLPGQVQLENITFTSITNDLIQLVVMTNGSYGRVRDCNFTDWELATNNLHGAQLSIDGPAPTQPPGNVGLVIGSSLDHATYVEDCFFAGLACGIDSNTDHFYGRGLKSAFIGLYGIAGTDGTAWPNTSAYSLGPFLLFRGGLSVDLEDIHFYGVDGGVVLDGNVNVMLWNPQWEAADHAIAAFNPSGQVISIITDSISDDTTKYAVTHGPYAYSTTTAIDARYAVYSKLLANIGLNGNNNPATNFSVISATTFQYGTNPGPLNTNFTVYAAGTAYTLTGSSAALDFGTTDPILTLNQTGTYLITGNVGIKYNGATYAGAQTATLKFRRTNNTAADLTSGSRAVEMPVLTTFTGGDVFAMPPVIYTATAGDTVTIFGILSATPAAGSVLADSAEMVAIRLY